MPGFYLYHGNQTEYLTEQFIDVLKDGSDDPFESDKVLVQSRGMERYLKMRIADSGGNAFGIEFPFPNHFLGAIIQSVLQREFPIDSSETLWKIHSLLQELKQRPSFEHVSEYLASDQDYIRTYRFCETSANLLDRYMVHRPDMTEQWSSGNTDSLPGDLLWQYDLWQSLFLSSNREDPPSLLVELEHHLDNNKKEHSIPGRVFLFGITSLPSLHMRIFFLLSRIMEVHYFVLSPSEVAASPGKILHPITQSLGTMGSDFFSVLTKEAEEKQISIQYFPLYRSFPGDSLLSGVQNSLMADTPPSHQAPIPFDSSFRVRSCHTPLREIESLYNEILSILSNDDSLLPSDILVMTQDIDAYAPLIESVFGDEHSDVNIPYTIADRIPAREKEFYDGIDALLSLQNSMYSSLDVISLLELPIFTRRFNIQHDDLDLIRRWSRESGVRRALNVDHMEELNLPPYDTFTWEFARKRLLLGYALPGDEESIFEGILPLNIVEGGDADLLGRFLEFLDMIERTHTLFKTPRNVSDFATGLFEILNDLSDHSDGDETSTLRKVIEDIQKIPEKSGFYEPVDVRVIREELKKRYSESAFGRGFLSGGITFCAMMPMRSVPFRVVCILGLNMDSFPASDHHPSFDIISSAPRPGDRIRRMDDRQLFLEALLSARDVFYISYVGRNIANNAELKPSVVVTELLESLDTYFLFGEAPEDQEKPSATILKKHRLHGFYPEYFFKNDELPASYSSFHAEGARTFANSIKTTLSEFADSDTFDIQNESVVSLEDFIRYFEDPSSYFLKNRAGIFPDRLEVDPGDIEPFSIEGLEQYGIGTELVYGGLQKRDTGYLSSNEYINNITDIYTARGILPAGSIGRAALTRLIGDIIQPLNALIEEDTREHSINIRLTIDNTTIQGEIPALIGSNGVVFFRMAKFKGRYLVKPWILYLLLNLTDAYPVSIRYLCKDKKKQSYTWHIISGSENDEKNFDPHAGENENRKIIEYLIRLYNGRMEKPIPFFPDISFEAAEILLGSRNNNLDREQIIQQINDQIESDYNHLLWTESDSITFRGIDPLEHDDFFPIVENIIQPLIKRLKSIEVSGE